MKRFVLVLIALMVLCCAVQAVPTTLPATLVGNNNATLNGNGVTGAVGWFQWSMKSGVVYAHLPNVTAIGGVMSYKVKGTPLYGSTQYFYKACDPTGCGAELSFTTTAVTPNPTPNINGVPIDVYVNNMTENGFDPQNMAWNAMRPFMAVTTDTVFFGIIFAIVIVSMWLRTRGTQTATVFMMICLSLFGVSGALLGGGVLPQEFLAVGQALLYVSITGAILSWTFK